MSVILDGSYVYLLFVEIALGLASWDLVAGLAYNWIILVLSQKLASISLPAPLAVTHVCPNNKV
jgi:hypothetical protein